MGCNFPDTKRRQARKSRSIAVGAHHKEPKSRYRITPDTIQNRTLDIIFHTPKLCKPILASDNSGMDCLDLIEYFPETDDPWPQQEELELFSFGTATEHLVTLIQKSQKSLRVLFEGNDARNWDRCFWLSTSFPALETVIFDDYIEFPVIPEDVSDDDSVGLTAGFEPIACNKRECRELVVSYSGPGICDALGILAKTVKLRPWWRGEERNMSIQRLRYLCRATRTVA